MYEIKDASPSLLPRERLVEEGAEQLSNQELLAILLRTGLKGQSSLEIAQLLLKHLTSLAELRYLTLSELQAIPGVGLVKAIELKAMVELGKRIDQAKLKKDQAVLSSHQLGLRLVKELGSLRQEHLRAIYLDTRNQILEERTIFIGSVSRSLAEPREILHYAVKHMATSLIVVHNHPSGSLKPSPNDDRVTRILAEAAGTLGIQLLDHLIITQEAYFSYREEERLPQL
ncbi:DNA repair protein RadC [Streptococcus danieliae]|uniref:DNA repair protein RadC n=1 Tax=Streptococcus danieliae TaxID=747656 RepID=A0A7Z0LDF1_9STRE|nr:DNA repair protein RadC [Streptococcus danieliae]MBF0717494.1 DNA repair protein RadC [Streptococcus danieliae]MCU0082764.1 DNA repair protein RadC [Streptococcus danieliae]NYS49424.1 DNA repair protein RadC [Streptococcus danieliae]